MIDFQKQVIDRSFEMPVVVDFWAPWCGPCRILGPVIEQIATEQEGQWALVKLNTEEQEEISYQYGIRSIPNVKMFYRGEVIDEFTGALPRQIILEWLKKGLPKPGLMALDQLLAEHANPEAAAVESLLARYPDSAEIRIVLSQLILWDQPARVTEILEPIKMGTPYYDKASHLREIASFLCMSVEDAEIIEIKALIKGGHLHEVLPKIIATLGKNPKAADGQLAKAAIGIFQTLGTQHELTKAYRKQLDMVLWA